MNESARSMPSNSGRADGASSAAPPYAPSTWNQSPRSAQTSAIPGEVVDGPGVRRPGARHDREHPVTAVRVERGPERVARQPPAGVVGDREHVHVHDARGRRHARVGGVAGGDPPPVGTAASSLGRGVTGRDQRRQVPRRASRHEDAAALRREPGQVGDPSQRLVLGPDRARAVDPPRRDRGRRAHDQVEQDGRARRRAGDERERRRVVGGDRGRRQHVGPEAERLLPPDAVGRDRLTRERIELLGRDRPVERLRQRDAIARVRLDRPRQPFGLFGEVVHRQHVSASCATDGPARRAGPGDYRIRSCVSRRAPGRSPGTRRCTSGRRPRCAAPRSSTAPRRRAS